MGYNKQGQTVTTSAEDVRIDSLGMNLEEAVKQKKLGSNVKDTLNGGEHDSPPSVAAVNSALAGKASKTEVANGLAGKQAVGDYATRTEVNNAVSGKQATLVSGQNIKTVNGQSLLGSGNMVIQGGSGSGDSVVAGTNVTIETTSDGKKKINANIPTGTTQVASQVAYTNSDGTSTTVQAKLTELDEEIASIDVGGSADVGDYIYEEEDSYGMSTISLKDVKDLRCARVFGRMVSEASNSQLFNDASNFTFTTAGITLTIDGESGYITLNGTSTGSSSVGLIELPTDYGNYHMSIVDKEIGEGSSIGKFQLLVRFNDDRTTDSNNFRIQLSSSANYKAYTIDKDLSSCKWGIYIPQAGIVLNNVRFKIMINKGESPLDYEQSEPENIISFPANSVNLAINSDTYSLTLGDKPLRGYQPMLIDGGQFLTYEKDFTYSDERGTIYIADYAEFNNKTLRVIRNVGSFVYTESTPLQWTKITAVKGDEMEYYYCIVNGVKLIRNGKNKCVNFYSSNVNGVVDGATIYYQLETPIEELHRIYNRTYRGDITISNNKTCYMMAKSVLPKYVSKMKYELVSEYVGGELLEGGSGLWGFAKNGNYLYAAGFRLSEDASKPDMHLIRLFKFSVANGIVEYVSHFDITNTCNKATSINVKDGLVYVVTRSTRSATTADPYNEYGNIFIVREDLSELVSRTSLMWKGCDAKIFKNHLIVTEQLGYFEIFSLADPEQPLRTYGYAGPKHLQWSYNYETGTEVESEAPYSQREYQHLTCWSNGNKDYFACGGFATGVHGYDITNPCMPVRLGTFTLYTKSADDDNMYQMFDAKCTFPYLYMTIAKDDEMHRFSHNRPNGVITASILDVVSETDTLFKDADFCKKTELYCTSDIPEKLRSDGSMAEGDHHPSRLAVGENFMSINNGDNMAIFSTIGQPIPRYEGLINFETHKGSTDAMIIEGDNLYCASGQASGIRFIRWYKVKV